VDGLPRKPFTVLIDIASCFGYNVLAESGEVQAVETIVLKQRPAADGTLTISIPVTLRDKELEILVVMQPVTTSDPISENLDERGWPVGFFEETYGSLSDDLLERLPQGDLEVREVME
jgi:hypothetical protein